MLQLLRPRTSAKYDEYVRLSVCPFLSYSMPISKTTLSNFTEIFGDGSLLAFDSPYLRYVLQVWCRPMTSCFHTLRYIVRNNATQGCHCISFHSKQILLNKQQISASTHRGLRTGASPRVHFFVILPSYSCRSGVSRVGTVGQTKFQLYSHFSTYLLHLSSGRVNTSGSCHFRGCFVD